MPTLEISQRVHYDASRLEKMLEGRLSKCGMSLSRPVTLGTDIYALRDGIWRYSRTGNKSLIYVKFFKDENEFIKHTKKGVEDHIYVDEKKLDYILNSNSIYSEDLKLAENSVEIVLTYYPSGSRKSTLEIDLKEEEGIELFIRVVNNHYKTAVDYKWIRKIMGNGGLMTESDMREVTTQLTPFLHSWRRTEVVDMFVNYFAKEGCNCS